MSTNEINRDLGLLVREKTREILKLRKELREAENRTKKALYFADWFATNGDWHTDWDRIRCEHLDFEKEQSR